MLNVRPLDNNHTRYAVDDGELAVQVYLEQSLNGTSKWWTTETVPIDTSIYLYPPCRAHNTKEAALVSAGYDLGHHRASNQQ